MHIESAEIGPEGGHASGRKLLQAMYERYIGTAMPPILTAPLGKPYFAEGDVHFSISHTPNHVFCVIAHQPVGIDAEEMDREIRLALAEKILSPTEKIRYENAENKRETLLRLWVLKEAEAKCTGTGLQGYPNYTDFSPDDPRIITMNDCFVAVVRK